ncbi:MAG: hypothetical protein WCG01_02375 [bacterium]
MNDFKQKAMIYRLVSDQGKTKEAYEYYGECKVSIRQIKAEDLLISEGNPAKMAKLYADQKIDINETDKLICEGVEYIIKNIVRVGDKALRWTEAIIYKPSN